MTQESAHHPSQELPEQGGRPPLTDGQSTGCSVRVTYQGGLPIVTIEGELDMATADRVATMAYLELPAGLSALTVDLSNLTFLDSAGSDGLLALRDTVRAKGASLTFTGTTDLQARVLRAGGLLQA